MTNNTKLDINMLLKLAQTALGHKEDKNFILSNVFNQAREAYKKYPEDSTIRQFAFVIENIINKRGSESIITQTELYTIYNSFSDLQQNSKFASVLGNLIGETKYASNTNDEFVGHYRVDACDSEVNMMDGIDSNLLGELNDAFGNKGGITSKAYNVKLAEKGKEYVREELRSLGFSHTNVSVLGGNEDNLVYAAEFDSAFGRVPVAIPINLTNQKLVFPSTFVADDKLSELTAENLNYFIDKKAKNKDFNMAGLDSILYSLDVITGKVIHAHKDISCVPQYTDMAMYLNNPYSDASQKVNMPDSLAHLTADFEDQVVEANSSFGREAVNKGKNLIYRELKAMGFHSQVKYGSENSDSIVYLANITSPNGQVSIEVPLDIRKSASGNSTLFPVIFAKDDNVMAFNSENIQTIINSGSVAPNSINAAYKFMTLPELKQEIYRCASVKDYAGCESILSHIEGKFSSDDYKNIISDYHHALVVKAELDNNKQHKCSRLVPAGKTSIYDTCGHFNVPISQVVADSNGNCMLKTAVERDRLNPIEETGAVISTSKLYWT